MMCKQWWNGPLCQKKIKFMSLLPFDASRHITLAERLATVQLCIACPYRMFVLPKYAVDPRKVKKYSFIWKNRNILAILYGELNETKPLSRDVASPLLVSIRRKRTTPIDKGDQNVRT